ncbi:MAG: prolipoprotein diacylglyceryl transferase [Clostridia bacterium]|jgi:phosphatidylglycerol:prolipoprotein diacylglycerol transferase|nr:prolipoprotein diacylglyceryl transferase [Clostridia bacterium]MBQ2256763.1 prolipoprotein diacylglyceryl transferase [Clostridia bacterium]
MYPYLIIDLGKNLQLGLYDLCLMIAILACLVLYRVFADRQKFKARVQNFALIVALFAIGGGYYAAALVQTFYNWNAALAANPEAKFFDFWGTGATFYGGLVGGVLIFLVLYFGVGALLFKEKENIHHFFPIATIAGAVIPLAHGIGRMGCFFAGCCHGKVFEEKQWFTATFYIPYTDGSVKEFYAVPVQLFEAIFLFLLAAVLLYRLIKNKHYNLPIYVITYGVWRFFAEYLRADARGQGIIPFLSPSQQTALLLIALGVGTIFIEKYVRAYTARATAAQEMPATEEKDEETVADA